MLLLIVLEQRFDLSSRFSAAVQLDAMRALLKENLPLAVLVYCALTVLGSVVLALPGISFAILAGMLFGPVLGTICCSAAATLGAVLAFLCGRFFLKDSIRPLAMKNRYLKKWLFDETGKNQLFVLMITRLLPLFPYNLQNFAYGVTDIRFGTYVIGSFFFMLPGTAMYTVGTAGILEAERRPFYFCIAGGLAVLLCLCGMLLKKRYFAEGEKEIALEVVPEASGKAEPDAAVQPPSACIRCGKCRENCVFLKKYGLVIGDTEALAKLSYHCFLCGRCTEVCPMGIDGRAVLLQLRQAAAAPNKRPPEKGYGLLIWEKKNYKFQNYRNMHGTSVLFPGCNFPSFYPKTTKKLARLLDARAGIGTVFDCCAKPLFELGMTEAAAGSTTRIDRRLKEAGVEEVIMLCPGCYHFLKPRLSVRVVSIYEKLKELGLGQCIEEELHLFLPCPDRKDGALLQQFSGFLKKEPKLETKMQCCGLGGCASLREPALSAKLCGRELSDEKLCTYCATCSGALQRKGHAGTEHVLLKLLGEDETPDTAHSLQNRIAMRFWRL